MAGAGILRRLLFLLRGCYALALPRRIPCGFVAVRRAAAVGSPVARMLMIPHKVSVVLMDALSGCSSRGCSLGVSVVLGEINKLPSPDMGVRDPLLPFGKSSVF